MSKRLEDLDRELKESDRFVRRLMMFAMALLMLLGCARLALEYIKIMQCAQ